MILKIPAEKIGQLRTLLEKNNYVLEEKPYQYFRAVNGSFTIDIYKSGEVLLGDRNKGEKAQILRYISVLLAPDISVIKNKYPEIQVFGTRIGINSIGEGEYWGPLVCVGIFADDEQAHKLLQLKVQNFEALDDISINKLAAKIRGIIPPIQIFMDKVTPKQYNSYFYKHEHFTDMDTIYEILMSGYVNVHSALYHKNFSAKTVIYPVKLKDEKYTIGNMEYELNRLAGTGIQNEPSYTWAKEDLYIYSPRADTEITVVAAGIIAKDEFLKIKETKKPLN